MKCILNYCGGSISLHCNFWHVIFDALTRDIGCVARELDWELVTSKITGLMSPFAYCIGGLFADFGKETICFLHIFGPRLLTQYIQMVAVFRRRSTGQILDLGFLFVLPSSHSDC